MAIGMGKKLLKPLRSIFDPCTLYEVAISAPIPMLLKSEGYGYQIEGDNYFLSHSMSRVLVVVPAPHSHHMRRLAFLNILPNWANWGWSAHKIPANWDE